MNLFLAGLSEARLDPRIPRDALEGLLADLPFFDQPATGMWFPEPGRILILTVAHSKQSVGGIAYTAFEPDRAALFAGRPILWSDGERATGSDALCASGYHARAEQWASRLDGRCAVLRAELNGLELVTDALGAYPVFEAEVGCTRWFSNSPEVLRRLAGSSDIDEEALASLLGGGWSLGGHPIWRAVRRIPRGTLLKLGLDGRRDSVELLPIGKIVELVGHELDIAEASSTLVELVAGLSDWPGRPSVVPITGGRDSRMILAAALAAGIRFAAQTAGAPTDPDVMIGARLCSLSGIAHEEISGHPHGDRFTHVRRAARITMLTAGGTATLQDGAGYPLDPWDSPLPLWHSGQGGEIARAYYGVGHPDVAERLYTRFVGHRPGRTEIVSRDAAAVLRSRIGEFVDQTRDSGADVADVPDLFYLLERMACWAAPTHSMVELVRDTTSPLWSARLLRGMLALTAEQRAVETFHYRVLERLAPSLLDEPFQDGSTWPSRKAAASLRAEHALSLGRKVRLEVQRRIAARCRHAAPSVVKTPIDPFDSIIRTAREAAHSQPHHPAWSVVDRRQVTTLLGSAACDLDDMNRMFVWRLATVFLGLG